MTIAQKEIAREIISGNLIHKMATYLEEKKMNKKEWPLILSELVKSKNEKISSKITYQIQYTINNLLEDVENFTFLLQTLIENGYDSSTISVIISDIKMDHAKLSPLYKKISKSSNVIVEETANG